jgi:hypothetical protein
MANSTQIREDLAIFLQSRTSTRLKNTLFSIMPTLEFFFALNGDKTGADGLGRPKSSILVSSFGTAKAQQAKMFAERVYLPIIQTTKPDKTDIKAMSDYDNDPVVPNWDTDNKPLSRFKQPRFKFARLKMPYKVPHSEIRTAKVSARTEGEAAKAIGSVYDVEVKNRTAVTCEVINDMLWGINGQTGLPTSEDAVTWNRFHSIEKALDLTSTYGGIDKSLAANSWFRGNYVSAATTKTFDDLINYCSYDLGLAAKGLGIQMIAVGATLFKKAKAEAKTEGYQLTTTGIPGKGEWGFKREIVTIHSGNRPVYVYYDPAVPAGHAACLDPSSWTVAFAPEGNFKVSKPVAANEVDEGGDEADFGTINVELMICCEVPSANVYWTNLS